MGPCHLGPAAVPSFSARRSTCRVQGGARSTQSVLVRCGRAHDVRLGEGFGVGIGEGFGVGFGVGFGLGLG